MKLKWILSNRLFAVSSFIWISIGLFSITKALFALKISGKPIYFAHITSYTFSSILFWIVFSILIHRIVLWMKERKMSLKTSILLHMALAIFISSSQRYLSLSLDHVIQSHFIVESFPTYLDYLFQLFPKRFIEGLAIYTFIISFYYIANYFIHLPEPYSIKLTDQYIIIQKKGSMQRINCANVSLIRSKGNYVLMMGKEEFKHRSSLKAMEDQLNHTPFIRLHHSCIVNREKIKSIVHLSNGEYQVKLEDYQGFITSSKKYKANIKQVLTEFQENYPYPDRNNPTSLR